MVYTLLVLAAARAVGADGAHAKGRSGPWYFQPGDAWHRRTEVSFKSVDGLRKAMRTQYFAYMIQSRVGPDVFMKLGRVSLKRDKENGRSVHAVARFEIPDVPMGRYVVTFCSLGCKSALGQNAPVFYVHVVKTEGQRSMFSWLDDWVMTRRGLEFFEDELGRVAWKSDSNMNNNNLQDWHHRALTERVVVLEKMDQETEPSRADMLFLGLVGGMLAWTCARVGTAAVTRLRKRSLRTTVIDPQRRAG